MARKKKWQKHLQKKNNLSVTFKSFVTNVDEYVQKADFVFVSRYLGILESLAHKKIVFSVYNNEIKKDYLQNTPFAKFIFIAKTPKHLAQQIKTTLTNVQFIRQKENQGYLWARGQTWQRLTNLYLGLWQ